MSLFVQGAFVFRFCRAVSLICLNLSACVSGEESSRTGLRSSKKNAAEDKQGKVVHLMANVGIALKLKACYSQ